MGTTHPLNGKRFYIKKVIGIGDDLYPPLTESPQILEILPKRAKGGVYVLNKVKKKGPLRSRNGPKRAKTYEKGLKIEFLGQKYLFFCGFFFSRMGGNPLPPLAEICFA